MKRDFVGSSDVALVRGDTPFGRSAFTLWERILSGRDEEFERPFRMQVGNYLEPSIIKELLEALPEEVKGLPFHGGPTVEEDGVAHPDYPFMQVHPDAWALGDGGKTVVVLEAKVVTVAPKMAKIQKGEIPNSYREQVLYQMAIMKAATKADVVRGFMGFFDLADFGDPVFLEVEAADGELDALVQDVNDWWQRYVVTKRPPPVNGDGSGAAAAAMFPDDRVEAPATAGQAGLLNELIAAKSAANEAKKIVDEIEAEIRQAMLDVGVSKIWSDTASYSYAEQRGKTTFDREAFERDHPGVYNRYTKTGAPFRAARLTIKKEK